jgi:hypothetical protein
MSEEHAAPIFVVEVELSVLWSKVLQMACVHMRVQTHTQRVCFVRGKQDFGRDLVKE